MANNQQPSTSNHFSSEDPLPKTESFVHPTDNEAESEDVINLRKSTDGAPVSSFMPPGDAEPAAVDAPVKDSEYDSEETIDEVPISKYRPRHAATTPLVDRTSSPKASEMLKHPEWLPENWRIEVIKRTSGLTIGRTDSYYFSPTGERFRSKKAVEKYLEEQAKAEATSPAAAPAENTPAKKKRGRPRKYGA